MRVLRPIVFVAASIAVSAPAFAVDPLPDTGGAKLAAYLVCRPLAAIDMGPAGAESSTECNGVVRNLDGQKAPDNLAIRCIEATSARPDGYKYSGTCVQTDADKDKLFMTYDGTKSGQMKWVGGTGKYKDVAGSGSLGVLVAPAGEQQGLFAYTMTYEVAWSHKAK